MRICKTMSLDTSEHLMIVYVAEDKRQLHCISMGIKRCIFSCGVSTKIAYGGSNLQLSMYKLHKRVSYCFFYLMTTKFILVLLSKNMSKIGYSKSRILYHITYTTIEALLYQPIRIILTFESNRIIIYFGRRHCKYDMHICFHASFLCTAFKSFVDDKDFTAQSACKNN